MAKAKVTAGFSSEPRPLCSYFCLSFASLQGARGPDGPTGEPGARGVKVSAKAALSSAVKCSGQDQCHILLQEQGCLIAP